MKAAVDKKVGKPLPFRELETARFARRLPDIQKYFAFILAERKREHVGLVGLFAVLPIHMLREHISAYDEREFKTRAEGGARDFFKRNIRNGAANSTSYVQHYR